MKNPSLIPILLALVVMPISVSAADAPPVKAKVQKVLGIGGLFFRSENPQRLAQWYETTLASRLCQQAMDRSRGIKTPARRRLLLWRKTPPTSESQARTGWSIFGLRI